MLKPVFLLFNLLSFLLASCTPYPPMNAKETPQLKYEKYQLEGTTLYTLLIPAHPNYNVSVASASSLKTLEQFAQSYSAIAVLNGGFFDPKNGKTTSYLVQEGHLIGDPRQNERLINNPDLKPYLNQILNRSEWRRYQCGQSIKYAIAFHRDPIPPHCQLKEALGGGPRILPQIEAKTEAFWEQDRQGRVIRDALGMNQANARTALGIMENGDLFWVMASQTPSGISLPDLAQFLKERGIKEAINLDGGSSSAFYSHGSLNYGKLDAKGNPVQRPVKSVLILSAPTLLR